ncbi:MAG TPA: integrase arm-type DNA-binding domain-containing protein [Geminicoccus sp.]|jgi:integrase|uniref:tyrosine-type recombinase/integrase n=1 Tax=Geminicoccus sp. TaxID=2024832 RepID=UPI002E35F256|nr:integrase arm-type DNA-binding domain-containing protein [Geminicoccus sp.]HEX2528682.1 integrase arm-type DNA-binding domain-containing protein [Geminicoccus sp.]
MGRRSGVLTARRVETALPGIYEDGAGLRLVVKSSGARSWVLRYQLHGKRHDLGLGGWPDVSLARAREKAAAARSLKADGVDPLAERGRRIALTFRDAAEALIESKRPGWRNAKHAAQWGATLATYAYPKIGDLDVRRIATTDVLDVLRPLWTQKTETASRLRQRIEAVLDYATATGGRAGDNPARWKGHLQALLPAPAKVARVEHHAALPWQDAPSFMAELAHREGTAARALAFAILTAARSGEVRGMTWAEIDGNAAMWVVPAGRMKAHKEHRVPLTLAALALLPQRGEPGDLIFPGTKSRPLSDMSLTAVLRRMQRGDLTVHGFRSTFRDWAGEATPHPREVIEAALAHRLKDKAEAAYARGDMLTKRRTLMQDWSEFLQRPEAEVVAIRAAAKG